MLMGLSASAAPSQEQIRQQEAAARQTIYSALSMCAALYICSLLAPVRDFAPIRLTSVIAPFIFEYAGYLV